MTIPLSVRLLETTDRPHVWQLKEGYFDVSVGVRLFGNIAKTTGADGLQVSIKHQVRLPFRIADPHVQFVGLRPSGATESRTIELIDVDAAVSVVAESLDAGLDAKVELSSDSAPNRVLTITCRPDELLKSVRGSTSLSRTVRIKSTDAAGNELFPVDLPVLITVNQPLQISPRVVVVGPLRVNETAAREVTVRAGSQAGVLSLSCEPDRTTTLTAEVKPQTEPELFQVSLNASATAKGSHSSVIKATLTTPDGEVYQQSIPVLVNVR